MTPKVKLDKLKDFSLESYSKDQVISAVKDIRAHINKKSIGHWIDYNLRSHTLAKPLTTKQLYKKFKGINITNDMCGEGELITSITLCYCAYEGFLGIVLDPFDTFESYVDPPTDIDPDLDPAGFNNAVLNFWEQIITL